MYEEDDILSFNVSNNHVSVKNFLNISHIKLIHVPFCWYVKDLSHDMSHGGVHAAIPHHLITLTYPLSTLAEFQ